MHVPYNGYSPVVVHQFSNKINVINRKIKQIDAAQQEAQILISLLKRDHSVINCSQILYVNMKIDTQSQLKILMRKMYNYSRLSI